ncbi:MAG: MFS transporter [candidate division NC10 bacterium]|nr:MFS transporter [candidate division NC10 bacterium]MBI4413541.1 MFS transporter [candidate division NC10 bacterium]
MRRWVAWAAATFLFLLVTFHRFALGVIAADLMAAFATAAVGLGGLASVYFYLYGLLQLPSGILADTWGPRRTLAASALLMTAGAFLFAAAPSLPVAYAGRVLVGLGVAPVLVNTLKLISEWFPALAFATMVGLTAMVGNLGGFLAGGPFALLVAAVGWRVSFATVGAITAALGAALLLAVRDRPAQAAVRPAAVAPALWPAAAALLRDGRIWLLLMTKMGFDMAFFAFFVVWGIPFLTQTTGVSPTVAGFHLSFGALGFMLGGPVLGFLSDRVMRERRRPILLSALAHTALWALFLGSAPLRPGAGLAALMAGLGFTAAGLLLCLACAKELSPPETMGIWTALVNGGGFFGAAVLQIVLGAVLDSRWEGAMVAGARVYPLAAYLKAFSLCLVIMTGTCLAAFFIREAGVLRTTPAEAIGTSGYKK